MRKTDGRKVDASINLSLLSLPGSGRKEEEEGEHKVYWPPIFLSSPSLVLSAGAYLGANKLPAVSRFLDEVFAKRDLGLVLFKSVVSALRHKIRWVYMR